MRISGAQIKAARALLGWPRVRLAVKSSVSDKVIADFETSKRDTDSKAINQMREALEAAGVAFTNAGDPCMKAAEEGAEIPNRKNRVGRRGNYSRHGSPRSK